MKFTEEELEEIAHESPTVIRGCEIAIVEEDEEGGKHDLTTIYVTFTCTEPDDRRFYRFFFDSSYNEGSSFDCSVESLEEVEPYEETVTKYRAVA